MLRSIRKAIVPRARALLHKAHVDLIRYPTPPEANRIKLFRAAGVDLVLDVGANKGQYGSELRKLGYRGRIVSFEPVSTAFAVLERKRSSDELWETVQGALGRERGSLSIHVAANDAASSSLLPMLQRHVDSAPEATYVATEQVEVDTLRFAMETYRRGAARPLVKLDVQGYEGAVLDGAGPSLDALVGLEIEMSFVPLYEGSPLFVDLLARLNGLGFVLMGIMPEHYDPRVGQLLQVNGLFFRPF